MNETAAAEAVGEDEDAGVSREGESPPLVEEPRRPPTREEMRDRVKAALAEGRISEQDVLADLYASMYWTEVQVRAMFNAFSGSRLGRGMMKRMEKQIEREEMQSGEAEADA